MAKVKHSGNRIFILGSLYQWALASFVIVTLPLVLDIIYTVTKVTSYIDKSQLTLVQTVNATENGRILLERLIAMERSIRQFQVLNEPELFKAYQEHRAKFVDILESSKATELNSNISKRLEKIQQQEALLFQDILRNSKNKLLKLSSTDLKAFDKLSAQARSLLAEGEKRVAIEASKLSEIAKTVRETLVFSALASIPLALFFGLIFVNFITRPIKHIAKAIRNLGEDGFEQPIAIKGPKDLTELGKQLEWLRLKLSRLEHEKQQFIRNVSHELKTPLATLKEGTDLLAENVVGELNREQEDIIQLMKIGNITINDLVENLLEYQRTISTQIEINYSTFMFHILINQVINEYQLLLRSKNISLNSNLDLININADYSKLKIIISNMLSNALKFSPPNGCIGLTLRYHKNKSTIQLMIEDQGPGIAKDIQPYIFKDFYQGGTPQDWNIKATGLGLALVKYFLEAHKGSIQLLKANEEYCGARFMLQIPQKERAIDAT